MKITRRTMLGGSVAGALVPSLPDRSQGTTPPNTPDGPRYAARSYDVVWRGVMYRMACDDWTTKGLPLWLARGLPDGRQVYVIGDYALASAVLTSRYSAQYSRRSTGLRPVGDNLDIILGPLVSYVMDHAYYTISSGGEFCDEWCDIQDAITAHWGDDIGTIMPKDR